MKFVYDTDKDNRRTMGQRSRKNTLFLGTGDGLSARCAEIVFNGVAGKFGLPWVASSRAISSAGAVKMSGKSLAVVVDAMKSRGLQVPEDFGRPLPEIGAADLQGADWIVALRESEHLPLLEKRFPEWIAKVEFWQIDAIPESLARLEREVMDLASRLLRGGEQRKAPIQETCSQCRQPLDACSCRPLPQAPSKATVVRVGRETKGRRGKGVTTVSDLPLDENGLAELAALLKQRLGTGGTVKDGRIEIQGDHRDRIVQELEAVGYRAKRVGG
jgi:translation initiation factor 1